MTTNPLLLSGMLVFGMIIGAGIVLDQRRDWRRACAEEHNVSRCEWTRNPYTPVEKGAP